MSKELFGEASKCRNNKQEEKRKLNRKDWKKKARSSKIVLSCKVACYKDIQKNLFFKISQNMIGRYMNKKKMKNKKYRNLKIKE